MYVGLAGTQNARRDAWRRKPSTMQPGPGVGYRSHQNKDFACVAVSFSGGMSLHAVSVQSSGGGRPPLAWKICCVRFSSLHGRDCVDAAIGHVNAARLWLMAVRGLIDPWK